MNVAAEERRVDIQIALDTVRADHHGLVPAKETLEELYPAWRDYCTRVSAPDMAVSLETAALLLHLCRTREPATILDLGSGFSSYVLRSWAKESGALVASVDTDADWLERTRGYLAEHNLSTDGLVSLDHFEKSATVHDLVFHDLANGTTRDRYTAFAVERCAADGVIVFDDAQHGGHRFRAYQACSGKFDVVNVGGCTLDDTGRFALVAVQGTPSPSLTERFVGAALIPSDIYLHLPRMVELVDDLNASHVIELGSRGGVSTSAWLYALAGTDGRLTTVDLAAAPNIGEWPHWSHVVGDDCSPDVLAQLEPADIVFIDTSHRYEHTVRELNLYRWLVKPGGVMCLHDTELLYAEGCPDPLFPVKRAVCEFCAEYGFEWTNDERCYGFAEITVR